MMNRNHIFLYLIIVMGSATTRPMSRSIAFKATLAVAAPCAAGYLYRNQDTIRQRASSWYEKIKRWYNCMNYNLQEARHPNLLEERYQSIIDKCTFTGEDKEIIDRYLHEKSVLSALEVFYKPHNILQHCYAWLTCRKHGIHFQGSLYQDILNYHVYHAFPGQRRIFTIKSIPQYYFKMGSSFSMLHDDTFNIQRLVNAHNIRTQIQEFQKARPQSMAAQSFTVPKKWFYQMPSTTPRFLIIAEKLNPSPTAITKSNLVQEIRQFLSDHGLLEDTSSEENFLMLENNRIAIIDTEI